MTDEELARQRAAAVGRLIRRHPPCHACGAPNDALYLDPHHRPADVEAIDPASPVGIDETVLGVIRCAACGTGNGWASDTSGLGPDL